MVKQNLANKLAAGGFWALLIANQAVEVAHHLRERDYPGIPDDDEEVFVTAGLQIFQWFCNTHMDVGQLNIDIRKMRRKPQFWDKAGNPISQEVWAKLREDPDYIRIGLWGNETTHVSTVWVGCDQEPSRCGTPHLFETMVVKVRENEMPVIDRIYRTHSAQEAALAHQQIVAQVMAGRL